jgi:hypothetical protein
MSKRFMIKFLGFHGKAHTRAVMFYLTRGGMDVL